MLRSRVQTVKKAQKRKWDVAGMVGVEMYAVKKLDRTWNESTGTTKVGETSGKRSKVSRPTRPKQRWMDSMIKHNLTQWIIGEETQYRPPQKSEKRLG